MPVLVLSAALAASAVWAAGAVLAHGPATMLGAFAFTRIQLTAVSILLACIVTASGGWETVSLSHTGGFLVSGVVGVLLGNLAWAECMRRGGPRRAELLGTLNAPFAAALGLVLLGEIPSTRALGGGVLALAGIFLAVAHGGRSSVEGPEVTVGPLRVLVGFGIAMALCKAIGFIAVKPALVAGTDPWAASTIRAASAGMVMNALALWPSPIFAAVTAPVWRLIVRAIIPGILGYVVATTLLLYALRHYDTGTVVVLGSLAPVLILPLVWIASGRPPAAAAWAGACLAVLGAALILTG